MLPPNERAQAIERLISHQHNLIEAATIERDLARACARQEKRPLRWKSILVYRGLVLRCRRRELRALLEAQRRQT